MFRLCFLIYREKGILLRNVKSTIEPSHLTPVFWLQVHNIYLEFYLPTQIQMVITK